MATRKLLSLNENGETSEIVSSSISYDDVTNKVTILSLTSSNLITNYNNGILISVNGVLTASSVSPSVSGSLLQYSSSNYVSNLPTVIGGDLSGSTTSITQIKSVANVTNGSLPFANGGTGLTTERGVFVKGAGNSIQLLSTTNSGSVVGLFSGSDTGTYWAVDDTDPTTFYVPKTYLYTSSSAGNTWTWTKTGNPRFVKITLVGGGGGGGGGGKSASTVGQYSGAGGGSGGTTQVILEAANITTALITIGIGGIGGIARTNSQNGTAGTSGTDTLVSIGFLNLTASAGAAGGGGSGNTTAIVGGSGGLGTLLNGATGGATASSAASTLPGGNSFYNSGGGGASKASNLSTFVGAASGTAYYSNLFAAGAVVNGDGNPGVGFQLLAANTYFYNNSSSKNSSAFFTGTGGGGGSGATGTSAPQSGQGGDAYPNSGGGGGGAGSWDGVPGTVLYPTKRGGNGASGFVIIETY